MVTDPPKVLVALNRQRADLRLRELGANPRTGKLPDGRRVNVVTTDDLHAVQRLLGLRLRDGDVEWTEGAWSGRFAWEVSRELELRAAKS